MRHITPTGFAKETRKPVQLLGSLRAVLDALPLDGILIVRDLAAARAALDLWQDIGREPPLNYVIASHGPNALYELPAGAVIGVAPDAWHGLLSAMWAEMQAILNSRFKTVHWG